MTGKDRDWSVVLMRSPGGLRVERVESPGSKFIVLLFIVMTE